MASEPSREELRREVVRLLREQNEWWAAGRVPPALLPEVRREEFGTVASMLDSGRIVAVVGPRRTGKSTVLMQVVEHLLEGGTEPRRILFFSADDPGLRLATRSLMEDVLAAYHESVLGAPPRGGRTYVLVDEVHALDGWEVWLKRYVDRRYPITFVISGSSATHLAGGFRESLLGRVAEVPLLPLTFRGRLLLEGRGELVAACDALAASGPATADRTWAGLDSEELQRRFLAYLLRGGFPESLGVEDLHIWQGLLLSDVLGKALYRDLVEVYGVRSPSKLEDVFTYVAFATSSTLSYASLSRNLGISMEAAVNYLRYLVEAGLVGELQLHAASAEKRIRANRKYFVTDPGLLNAVVHVRELDERWMGPLVESVVQSHLCELAGRRGFKVRYWRERHEVDAVLDTGTRVVPLEVKYASRVSKADIRGLLQCMERFGLGAGLVVTRDLLETRDVDGRTVHLVPARLALASLDGLVDQGWVGAGPAARR